MIADFMTVVIWLRQSSSHQDSDKHNKPLTHYVWMDNGQRKY